MLQVFLFLSWNFKLLIFSSFKLNILILIFQFWFQALNINLNFTQGTLYCFNSNIWHVLNFKFLNVRFDI